MGKNYNVLSQFFGGMTYDLGEHSEDNKTFQFGLNGRIYSKNGVISYSSIDGTIEVLSDRRILKYLGYASFADELILFTKTSAKILFSNNDNPIFDVTNYEHFLTCNNESPEIDYSDFYDIAEYQMFNFEVCPIEESVSENEPPFDTIYSVKKDEDGNLVHTAIWSGKLGWLFSDKIETYPIDENSYYKRVYFTDNRNVLRVINLKDKELYSRNNEELSLFQGGVLLEPIIQEITDGGALKACSVFYSYRLITDNGQMTQFSPHSEVIRIVAEHEGNEFEGGGISEPTDKKVEIKIYIPSYEKFKNIELVAIEYEAEGIPTAIRSLGVKNVAPAVVFEHVGTEAEFSQSITISELLNRSSNWKYCSTLNSVDNILFAGGLRNNPISVNFKRLQRDFALKSWNSDGETFSCLLNPKPYEYRYINTLPDDNSKNFVDVKAKIYTTIKSFGSLEVKLNNLDTGDFISIQIDLDSSNYSDILPNLINWLVNYDPIELEQKFPNLKISSNDLFLVFSRNNESILTDVSLYEFTYNNIQVIEDYYENYDTLSPTIDTGSLIHGAVSLGFNKGNGIRLSFKTEKDLILHKAFIPVSQDSKILHLEAPSLKRGFMKGEIYRPGIQINDLNGEELFVIPLGDIKIPEIGEPKSYINDQGHGVKLSGRYNNSSIEDDKLYAERTVIQAEIRISCHIKKYISSVKLVYVERDENNRTIVCQGFSGPMERYQHFHGDVAASISMKEEIVNKWCLPFNGGPTYDFLGVKTFDMHGENYSESHDKGHKRVITHRNLFYFDSPDIIYGKVSAEKINTSELERVNILVTDHYGGYEHASNFYYHDTLPYPVTLEAEPNLSTDGTFSRKIFGVYYGDNPSNPAEYYLEGNSSEIPYLVNISFFFNRFDPESIHKKRFSIRNSRELGKGEIISGGDFDLENQISNNAMVLAKQGWFHAINSRSAEKCSGLITEGGGAAYGELWKSNNVSKGYPTVVIKTNEPFFDSYMTSFYSQLPDGRYVEAKTDCLGSASQNGMEDAMKMHVSHALVNVRLNNEDSVYGGRTDYAYANNVYKSLSKTIPVLQGDNGIQVVTVQGDVYCTLYIRTKNDMTDTYESGNTGTMNSGGRCTRQNCGHEDKKRKGAWAYMTVLETSVEPRLTHHDRFYKNYLPYNFNIDQIESINGAYFQEANLKSYIPVPYNFKDEPIMNNIISASDVKLTGDYIDNWSIFRVNNFYEVEKDKGTVFNLAKHLNRLYAIQERQTSMLMVNQREMIQGTDGEIAVKQGDGAPISDHQIVSDYGTSIRRAIVEISANSDLITGFSFFDERKKEFIKISKPLLLENKYHLKMTEMLDKKKIIDSIGYFDDEYKETVIRLRLSDGSYYTMSYNEVLQKFNGFFEYNNDIFIEWDGGIYAPKINQVLHELNKGLNLKLFSEDKKMRLGVVINPEPNTVKIFKHWAGIINTEFHIDSIFVQTSLGQTRTITGEHNAYKIREGRHSVPLKNENDWSDLRGEWAYIEIEISHPKSTKIRTDMPIQKNKIDIFSFINFVRDSYQ